MLNDSANLDIVLREPGLTALEALARAMKSVINFSKVPDSSTSESESCCAFCRYIAGILSVRSQMKIETGYVITRA